MRVLTAAYLIMDRMVRNAVRLSLLELSCAIAVPMLWGVQFVVIKIGLATFPPLFFVTLRFAGAGLLVLPFAGLPSRRELSSIFVISIFLGGLNFGLFFAGLGQVPAGIAAIANQLAVPFAVLFAWPLLGERPTRQATLGLILALSGVGVTVIQPRLAIPILPTMLVVAAGVAWAIGNVLARRQGPFRPLKLMAWMSLFAVPQVLLVSILTEHGQLASVAAAGASAWLAFAYTVLLGAVAGWSLWFWLLGRVAMARVAPFAMLQIVAAIAAGTMLLDERVTPLLIIGAALCILGVMLTQAGRGPYEPPPIAFEPIPGDRQ